MKKTTKFEWNDQVDEAFRDLKRVISSLPILAGPSEREPILIYIAATTRVVSVVLVVQRKEEGKALPVQRPVY